MSSAAPSAQRPQAHLIDASAVFFRYYFAPGPEIFNEDGWDVGALLGATRWLLSQTEFFDEQTQVVATAFDESLGTGYRHTLDPDYKANRPLPTEDIIYQFSALKAICEALGFQVLASDTYEADDLIAVIAKQLPDHATRLHSRDKDLRQLLDAHTELVDFVSGKVWSQERLLEEEGLTPEQIPLYLALVGDASDNITGVPSVGDKTAKTLISAYGSWQGIQAALASEAPIPVRGAKRIAQNLMDHAQQVPHNLSLTLLSSQAAIAPVQWRQPADWPLVEALVDTFGIRRPLSKLLKTRQT